MNQKEPKNRLKVIPKSTALMKRGAKNRSLNQAQLREKLAASGHVGRIDLCLKRLEAISDAMKKKQFMEREEQAKTMTEIAVIKTRLDSHFKMLNKYLPDLRSAELDDDGESPLTAAIEAWAKAVRK